MPLTATRTLRVGGTARRASRICLTTRSRSVMRTPPFGELSFGSGGPSLARVRHEPISCCSYCLTGGRQIRGNLRAVRLGVPGGTTGGGASGWGGEPEAIAGVGETHAACSGGAGGGGAPGEGW